MILGMKAFLLLLLAISVLFSTESGGASIPENSTLSSTAEPSMATEHLTSAPALGGVIEKLHTTQDPATHGPAGVTAATTAPAAETKEATIAVAADPTTIPEVTPASTRAAAEPASTYVAADPTTTPDIAPASTRSAADPASTYVAAAPATTPETAFATTNVAKDPATTYVAAAPATTPEIASASTHLAATTKILPATTNAAAAATSPEAAPASTNEAAAPATTSATVPETSPSAPAAVSTSVSKLDVSPTPRPVPATKSPLLTSPAPGKAKPGPTTGSHTEPSTSAAPRVPKRFPIPTTRPTPATKSPPTKVQTCSTRGTVKTCLIAIASLALLATAFMVATIVLCATRSGKKYTVRRPQMETEMMCISSLLPDRTYNYSRQRNPVTNGVLVIHNGKDSDEEGDDNLTLHSFLPDSDRFT